ncbi:hypothetical protein KJK32_43990 [Streptomyces sp. JCM17656]|nr:hypothetical protein KJK32_43990 [Streptomyces sp. JCM17656]
MAGRYTSVNCTLTLLRSSVRISPDAGAPAPDRTTHVSWTVSPRPSPS